MKRTAMSVAILSVAVWAAAQTYGQAGQQTPPATAPAAQGGQAAPAGQTAPAPGAAITPAKRPPQAKTDPEFNAWKAADAGSRPTPEEQAQAQKSRRTPKGSWRQSLTAPRSCGRFRHEVSRQRSEDPALQGRDAQLPKFEQFRENRGHGPQSAELGWRRSGGTGNHCRNHRRKTRETDIDRISVTTKP